MCRPPAPCLRYCSDVQRFTQMNFVQCNLKDITCGPLSAPLHHDTAPAPCPLPAPDSVPSAAFNQTHHSLASLLHNRHSALQSLCPEPSTSLRVTPTPEPLPTPIRSDLLPPMMPATSPSGCSCFPPPPTPTPTCCRPVCAPARPARRRAGAGLRAPRSAAPPGGAGEGPTARGAAAARRRRTRRRGRRAPRGAAAAATRCRVRWPARGARPVRSGP